MSVTSIRFLACLASLYFVGVGASSASSYAPVVGAAPSRAAICTAASSAGGAQASHSSPRMRVAWHCYCCGRDSNGHCNHQCCD